MTMKRWLIAMGMCCVSVAGCSQGPSGNLLNATAAQLPAKRGTNPLFGADHLASIQVGLTGDQSAVRGHLRATHNKTMGDMRRADPLRAISRDQASAALLPVPGVLSSAWIDRSSLQVMVGGAQYRRIGTINRICRALEPLGDTLSVVVNVQDVTANTSAGAHPLSRNCQLRAGERVTFQQARRVDVLEP